MGMSDAATTSGGPDVDQIDRSTLSPHPIASPPAGGGFFVATTSAARAAIEAHTQSRTDVEVGGVLLGRLCVTEADGRAFLLIDAIIPALAADSANSSVTFTADTWMAVHDAIDRDHPGASIVGWYHTHPNFGIFLSEMDLFIQRHFFDLPHQVAVVVDPVRKEEGAFIWMRGETTRVALHPEEAQPTPPTVVVKPPVAPAVVEEVKASEAFLDLVRRRVRAFDARPSHFKPLVDRLSAASDAVRRLDIVQWIALIGLLALIAAIVAAAGYAWLDRRGAATQPTTIETR